MKKEESIKKIRQERRKVRTRKKLLSQKSNARLSVFRSNRQIYAQIIDDVKGVTVVSASEKEIESGKLTKTQKAEALGKIIAKKAQSKKIKGVVFDKGSYRYHGRVKALADGARSEGLEF